ncbi:MAG: hypothetical protein ABS44_04045 [Chryseobacterium sp. SCN 40-13]|nr:MAG: hypothetical protein ABS44_04045 [Chryseobacterium sp. SCN 40-13]
MIKLNRLYVLVLIGFVTIVSCDKKSISLEKQVSGIVDSLSKDEKHSYKLFTVQHQSKWDKSFIKISTAEFFNKDSAVYHTSSNGNLIVYYSNIFNKNKDQKQDIDIYQHLSYKKGTLSIFHPRYIILEIDENEILRDLKDDKKRAQLFRYEDRNIPEPVRSQ